MFVDISVKNIFGQMVIKNSLVTGNINLEKKLASCSELLWLVAQFLRFIHHISLKISLPEDSLLETVHFFIHMVLFSPCYYYLITIPNFTFLFTEELGILEIFNLLLLINT